MHAFQIEHKSLTLGEVLDGDRMAVSMYEINFKGESQTDCIYHKYSMYSDAEHVNTLQEFS